MSFFEAQHGFTQHLWHGHGGLCVGIGVHIEQLTGDQQLIATKYSAHKLDRRIADALTTQAHIQPIVVLGRRVVFQAGFFDVQITAQLVHGVFIGNGQCAPIVRHGGVEVHQVVAVEDNFL